MNSMAMFNVFLHNDLVIHAGTEAVGAARAQERKRRSENRRPRKCERRTFVVAYFDNSIIIGREFVSISHKFMEAFLHENINKSNFFLYRITCTRKTSSAITGLKEGDAPARNGFAATVVCFCDIIDKL